MQKEDVKSILKETTSEAVEVGAFGLPFIVIDKGKDHLGIENEVFFGSDRFEVIANCLGIFLALNNLSYYQIKNVT